MALLIMNTICICIAALIIISAFTDYLSMLDYATFFLYLFFIHIHSQANNSNFTIIFKVIISAALLTYFGDKGILNAVLIALTSESIITFSVLLLGPIVYLYPNIQQTIGYNIAACLLIMVVSIIAHHIIITKKIELEIQSVIPNVISKKIKLLIFLTELLIVLPVPILTCTVKSNKIITIFITNILVISVTAVACFIVYLHKLEVSVQRDKNRKIARRIIQKYKKVGSTSHLNGSALAELKKSIEESDIQSIKELYIRNIAPISNEFNFNEKENFEALQYIKMPIISDYLSDISIRCPNFFIKVKDTMNIENFDIDEIDLFLIIAELINNAVNNFDYRYGCARILFSRSDGNYYIEIENTLNKKFTFSSIFEKGINEFKGFGLRVVDDIIYSYPKIINQTYVSDSNIFVQCLIIPEKERI